jgi:hypothetical protein
MTNAQKSDFRKLLYATFQDFREYGTDQHRVIADIMVMEQWIEDRIKDAVVKAGVANGHIRLEQSRMKKN